MPSTSSQPPAVPFAPDRSGAGAAEPLWPFAAIILGLVLSAVWCVGLLWGAYLILDWTGLLAAGATVLDATPAR
jgi:hypothetical protein